MSRDKSISVEPIKECFPNPINMNAKQGDGTEYCVGGAIMGYFAPEEGVRFPTPHELGDLLHGINPNLSMDAAVYVAGFITGANDGRNYERAWEWAEFALTAPSSDTIWEYKMDHSITAN